GHRSAVVMGISDSAHDDGGRLDLRAARADAEAVSASLNDPANEFNVRDDRMLLLVDSLATQRNVRAAIARWLAARVTPRDTVIVYFAGHGGIERDFIRSSTRASDGESELLQEKYLLTSDFDPEAGAFAS